MERLRADLKIKEEAVAASTQALMEILDYTFEKWEANDRQFKTEVTAKVDEE